MNQTLRRHLLLLTSHTGRSARMLDVCLDASIGQGAPSEHVVPGLILYGVAADLLPDSHFLFPDFKRWQYQNTIESAYRPLPRPPQTPAARFKRLYRK